jgi:arylsulfatase A
VGATVVDANTNTENYIENAGPDPFFLYFALTSPHTPIVPNKQFLGTSRAGVYGDFVCEVDWVVGRIMEALDRKGITENTLVIFTSDNGPECSEAAAGGTYNHAHEFGHYSMAHLRGVKRDTWEGGHRVPFVASWPQTIPAGSTCDQLISLGDLMATCAELQGVELRDQDADR